MFLSRLHRKFGFRPRLKRWKATFFRPVDGKEEIPKVPGGKEEIPKSAGHVSPAQPETKMYTTVFLKHKLLVTSYIHSITSLRDAYKHLINS